MPDTDALWNATSLEEWSHTFERVHEFSGGYSSLGSEARPLSLSQLYHHFSNDTITSIGIELTHFHLRLLLCPLQVLVHQTRQSDASPAALKDLYGKLQRWSALALRYARENGTCVRMQTSFVLFHLISLNVWTDFAAIEQMARGEGPTINHINNSGAQHLKPPHRRHVLEPEQTIYHCGQVIRLVRTMPSSGARPPWWPGAVYRIALIMWFHAITAAPNDAHPPSATPGYNQGPPDQPAPGDSFQIDDLGTEHPATGRGVPVVTRGDGSTVGILDGRGVLAVCEGVLGEGEAGRLRDGIMGKLGRLRERCGCRWV